MDLFTTLVKLAHEEIPQDRFIDGNVQNNNMGFLTIFLYMFTIQVQIYELTWDYCHPDKPIIK